jgi:hypothetical protein
MSFELRQIRDPSLRFSPRHVVGVGLVIQSRRVVVRWSGHPRTQTEADHMRALTRLVTHWYWSF